MTNLILKNTSASELATVFAACPPINLLPPLGDAAWREVAKKPALAPLLKALRERALGELDAPMPELTAELYADFFKTGQRLPFEVQYFDRRKRLARAAIAALVEQDPAERPRLLASLVSKMHAVFDETSWTLPAHVWENPTGQDPMQIDLFAAETANLFGELLNLFGEILPPAFQQAIRGRLKTQYFDNYLAKTFHWTTITNNWNAVCHQGVLGAALAVVDDPQLLADLFYKAGQALKNFLAGFTPDGGSSEGPGYWGYGFGWFAELNDQLETRTRGRLSLVEGNDHIRAIAAFGPRMTLSNGYIVNFSDNGSRSVPRASLLQYLGERFDDPFIRASAAAAWQRNSVQPPSIDEARADVFHFTRHLLRTPASISASAALPETDVYLPDLSVAVTRCTDRSGHLWEFACKGGHNDEHHNHNDVGSYLLNIDGQRMLIEIGAPEYNRAFFSSRRYESIAARSLGHPVPLINGIEQPARGPFETPVLKKEFTPTRMRFAFDLTSAYPTEAGCSKCVREFDLDRPAGRLTITDTFDLTKTDAVESAVVTESPVTLDGGIATIRNGSTAVRILPQTGTQITEVQRHGYNDHHGKPAHMNRIVLRPTKLTARVVLGCSVEVG